MHLRTQLLLFRGDGYVLLGFVLAVLAYLAWRWLLAQKKAAEVARAPRKFDERRTELAEEFLRVASLSGKPRGLRWKSCELSGAPLFAEDVVSDDLCALVAATISFEAIEGGGMEEVEAVGNLRSATALFVYRDGAWTTEGRVIFNLEPAEAIARFGGALKLQK